MYLCYCGIIVDMAFSREYVRIMYYWSDQVIQNRYYVTYDRNPVQIGLINRGTTLEEIKAEILRKNMVQGDQYSVQLQIPINGRNMSGFQTFLMDINDETAWSSIISPFGGNNDVHLYITFHGRYYAGSQQSSFVNYDGHGQSSFARDNVCLDLLNSFG